MQDAPSNFVGPVDIGGFPPLPWQIKLLRTVYSRPAPKGLVINIYSAQRYVGKNSLITYLDKNLGAVTVSNTPADKKTIEAVYNRTDEQAMSGELTDFQQRPILMADLSANDDRLQKKEFYDSLEHLINGSFLYGSGWDPAPYIFVFSNHALDPNKLTAGRLRCFHINSFSHATPYDLTANACFDKMVEEKRADELAMAVIEDKVCTTGKKREVLVLEHVYCKVDDEKEKVAVGTMVEELMLWDPFFKRFKMQGKTVEYKKTPFKLWMNENFPDIKPITTGNYPYYRVKRQRS